MLLSEMLPKDTQTIKITLKSADLGTLNKNEKKGNLWLARHFVFVTFFCLLASCFCLVL
jgi:hypothetical protein